MMMHSKSKCLMMVLGIAAVIGLIWMAMMGMEKETKSPEGTLVKMMDQMCGMMS